MRATQTIKGNKRGQRRGWWDRWQWWRLQLIEQKEMYVWKIAWPLCLSVSVSFVRPGGAMVSAIVTINTTSAAGPQVIVNGCSCLWVACHFCFFNSFSLLRQFGELHFVVKHLILNLFWIFYVLTLIYKCVCVCVWRLCLGCYLLTHYIRGWVNSVFINANFWRWSVRKMWFPKLRKSDFRCQLKIIYLQHTNKKFSLHVCVSERGR